MSPTAFTLCRKIGRNCPGCLSSYQNRHPKNKGVSGVLINAHRLGEGHKSDRKLFALMPHTDCLSVNVPPNAWLEVERWPLVGQAVFEMHRDACKQISPKVPDQTVINQIIMRWLDQHLFRLVNEHAAREGAVDWKALPDALVEMFATLYEESGL